MVTLLDCRVGCMEAKLVVGYPVAVGEIGINSAEDEFFQ